MQVGRSDGAASRETEYTPPAPPVAGWTQRMSQAGVLCRLVLLTFCATGREGQVGSLTSVRSSRRLAKKVATTMTISDMTAAVTPPTVG